MKFEPITFSNGLTGHHFTVNLHRINFICDAYGLNVYDYRDFCKANTIFKATLK